MSLARGVPATTPEPSEALWPRLCPRLSPSLHASRPPNPNPNPSRSPSPSPLPKQASQLIKDVEKTFGLVDDEDDGAAAEE